MARSIAERPMVRSLAQRQLLCFALLVAAFSLTACSATVRVTAPSVTPATPAADAPSTPEAQVTETPVAEPIAPGIAESATPVGAVQEPPAPPEGFVEKKDEPAPIDDILALSDTAAAVAESTPELKQTVESDLQTILHDVPIPLNKKVLSYITLFRGRLHDFIQEGMARGAKYLPMIQQVFRAEGLPLDLAYIPLVESAFKTNALSRARAKGVWQFVRGTGLENGLRQDWYIDERSDPEKSTVAAAKYLSLLSTMFNGDWHLALASYNGGPGRVQRAQKRGRATDFWKLAEKRGILPRETREYVPMILAAIVVAKNPQQYGFQVDTDDALGYDTVILPGPVDLRLIAEWAGTTVDVIQSLNPELRRWTTPVRDDDYAVKVPSGTAVLVSAQLAEAVPSEMATLKYYTVKRGETITTIARKLGVTRADLADANYLKAAARLAIGQQLMVPRETPTVMAARANRPAPAAPAQTEGDATPAAAEVKDTVVPAVAKAAPADADETDLVKTYYRIKRGDTLYSIARAYKTTVVALQKWNQLSGSQIRAGDRLTIYTVRTN